MGCSCPPSPLRAVTQMAYLLPGSKALWGREARERNRMALLLGHSSACGSSQGRCDTGGGCPGAGGGRPGAGVTQVGGIPGLVARQPPQRPDCGLRAKCSWDRKLLPGLSCLVLDWTQAWGGCSVVGSWCSDSRGQHRATEGKGCNRQARPLGRAAHEAGPGMELLRIRSALGEERVSLPQMSVHSEAPAS